MGTQEKLELLEIEYPKLALGDQKVREQLAVILKIIVSLIFVVQTNIRLGGRNHPPRRVSIRT
jgi:hypothetical protein